MRRVPGFIRALETYVREAGGRVTRVALPEFVDGRTTPDLIAVRAGLPPLQELAALIHEVAHWLVHRNPRGGWECTLFEYEAEAVEALVLARLGLAQGRSVAADALLPASLLRVDSARRRICVALGVDAAGPPLRSEAQTAVEFQATPCEEIVFEYEAYGMGDFFGLPEAL